MNKLYVNLGKRSYDIFIENGLINQLAELLKEFKLQSNSILISNPTVFNLYGELVLSNINKAGIRCKEIIIPDGEEYKDFFWSYYILSDMLHYGLDRKSCVFALGGGVIGDIAGFTASLYMRGIPFIQIPTTLLAQVDSSVGGKTGVNHPIGKNMIGSFYQPKAVFIDTNTLHTLSEREFLSGLAEVIKYGIISDAKFFSYLEKNREAILSRDSNKLAHIIKTSCDIKSKVVSQDERESGMRAILNYGHTIGHAIETETGYVSYKHGEAVAIGMVYEAKIANRLGLLSNIDLKRIYELIQSYGLPFE
ncbi:MAG: 3-dehydroquinate synthase, partial [Thermodesulfovibrionales bacterium]|nr:3-dehydroquinate synthase [Thermodesulfovibrionales bacterium]